MYLEFLDFLPIDEKNKKNNLKVRSKRNLFCVWHKALTKCWDLTIHIFLHKSQQQRKFFFGEGFSHFDVLTQQGICVKTNLKEEEQDICGDEGDNCFSDTRSQKKKKINFLYHTVNHSSVFKYQVTFNAISLVSFYAYW